jgi:glutathione peroxidase
MMRTSSPAWSLAVVLAAAACSKSAPPDVAQPAAETTAAAPAAAAPEAAETAAATESTEGAALPADAVAAMLAAPINTLDGEPTSLAAFDGKALLLVNVASKCGLTPQYGGLEELHKTYAKRGFAVVGFPCNQFAGQEPGTAEEIKKFCSLTYGVTFPMMEKVDVNGAGKHPIYAALTQIPDAEGKAGDVQWNFEKFVVSADRRRIVRFRPRTEPTSPDVIAAIEAALPTAN